MLEHELAEAGLLPGAKLGKDLKPDDDLTQLHAALERAQLSCKSKISVKDQKVIF